MKIILVVFALVIQCNSTSVKPSSSCKGTRPPKVPFVDPSKVDWCDPKLLGKQKHHIACKHSGKFNPACLLPKSVEITEKMKQLIIDAHNDFRNQVAGGILPNKKLPTASRMMTFEWSRQLAYVADLNCKECKMEHDVKSVRTPQYDMVAQNIAMVWTHDPQTKINVSKVFDDSIDTWFSEIRHLRPEVFTWPASQVDPLAGRYGHTSNIINDGYNRIGCAASVFRDYEWGNYYNATTIVCNYSGDFSGSDVYDVGKPASKCEKGKNPQWPNLCHLDENQL